MNESSFPRPTNDDLPKEIAAFDEENGIAEELLAELFSRYRRNTVKREVMAKVDILNRLYSTRLYSVGAMTEQILSVKSFDSWLNAGSVDAAESILRCEVEGSRSTFSFASKYCSWHNPDAYPIYDQFVDVCLWYYQSLDHFASYKRNAPYSYETFVEIVNHFRDRYDLGSFSFKNLDKFLTRRGYEIVAARPKLS